MRDFGLVVYSNHNPREAARKLMRRIISEERSLFHVLTRFYGRRFGFTLITVYACEIPPEVLERAQWEDWWDSDPDDKEGI